MEWWKECRLWGQLNVQEHDPQCIDIERWKEYWRRTKIGCVTLNAGGIISYYPSEHALNWRSPWLHGRDLFGELVQAARDVGIHVLARFTPSRIDERFAMNYPDWCIQDEKGQLVLDTGHDPGQSIRMYHTCQNGPYYRWWIPEVMFHEIMQRYDVDGFFFNAWQSADRSVGPCHCKHCVAGFKEATGLGLPKLNDWGNPDWHAWLEWQADCVNSLAEEWRQAAHVLKATATVVMNIGGGIEGLSGRGRNWRRFFAAHDVIDADFQSRGTGVPLWEIGATGKILRSVMQPKPYIFLFGVYGGIGRISAQPPVEHQAMMSEMAASGACLWYHVIGACGEDRRPFDGIEKFYAHYDACRSYFEGAEGEAEIVLVFDHTLLERYGRAEADRLVSQPWKGAYAALVRARLPFDMLHADDLSADSLARYRVAVLPNLACLSEAQCDALRAFVQSGGSLVATFETSLYDEAGNVREDFLLGDLFGVTADTVAAHRHQQVHFRLDVKDAIAQGFEETNVISALDTWLRPVSLTSDSASSHITLVPYVPHMPPERVFFRVPKTDTPIAVLRNFGPDGGRVGYFACDMDRLCALPRNNPDHRRLFANAVQWALNGQVCVQVTGPGVIDVHVYRQTTPRRLLVHLVNCSMPDLWHPPAMEITPLGAQRVVISLEEGEQAAAARLVWTDRKTWLERGAGSITVEVPTLEQYEIVAIEME
ncbi:MAG: beta-galactosidase trimerization domain-containing protein [Candidatus Hydrogenedentes bacterium]|nr:beta-galactosidase trimerization domain-containing protein [Candidatus Hydrogenedentota bacterium]